MEFFHQSVKFASDVLTGILVVLGIVMALILGFTLMAFPYYIGWQVLEWVFK